VTRATMEAALAARATPLDRGALIRSTRRNPAPLPSRVSPSFAASDGAATVLPEVRDATGGVSLPDVSGLPARVAVRRLHALGLRVSPVGSGEIGATRPPAGTRVLPGDTISLRLGGSGR
jgi:hypothetical protein